MSAITGRVAILMLTTCITPLAGTQARANDLNRALLALSEADRNSALQSHIEKSYYQCDAVTRSMLGSVRGLLVWSARCSNNKSYSVELRVSKNPETKPVVRACMGNWDSVNRNRPRKLGDPFPPSGECWTKT